MFEQRSDTIVCLMEWDGEGGTKAGRPGGSTQCDLCCVFCNPFADLASPLSCSPVQMVRREEVRRVSVEGRGRAMDGRIEEV